MGLHLKAEQLCMAQTIYQEARGEPLYGQILVGQVIANRVRDSNYPTSVCMVTRQDYQFTYTETPRDSEAWSKALSATHMIMYGKIETKTKALHYTTTAIRPDWSKHMKVTLVYGNHRFYK